MSVYKAMKNRININELPSHFVVKELYKQYFNLLGKQGEVYSSHWRKYSKGIHVIIDDDGSLIRFQGCGFGDLQQTRLPAKILNAICNFSYLARMREPGSIYSLVRIARPIVQRIGTYLSYDCFRQICSLHTIRKHFNIDPQERFDVLIIGDGYGFLSALVKRVYPQARITLIDISEVLIFQAINLGRIYPAASHQLSGDDNRADFNYIPADKAFLKMERKYKLVINTASMQEMHHETIRKYFDLIRSSAVKDNLFYCCNRVSKILPCGEIVEFLKYPWDRRDRILLHEECPFYKYYFSFHWPIVKKFDGTFFHRIVRMHCGL